jgi:hypothetical protein
MMARVAAWFAPRTHTWTAPLALVSLNAMLLVWPAWFWVRPPEGDGDLDYSTLSPGHWALLIVGMGALALMRSLAGLALSVSLRVRPSSALLPYLKDEAQSSRSMKWAAASPRSRSLNRPRVLPGDERRVDVGTTGTDLY